MKSYLVDVPVSLNVFVRPHTLKRVYEVVKQARPSILFLVSDGPREWVPSDKQKIAQSRRIVEDIDWDCEVFRIYSDINKGMFETSRRAKEFIFNQVDRTIFLEDDVIPSISFFQYCANLLEKYKDDLRINMICGMNHMGVYEDASSDYFFSKAASIWGVAMWRRTYELYYDYEYGEDTYVMKNLLNNSKMYKAFCRDLVSHYKNSDHYGRVGSEFHLFFNNISQNQLNILPKKNMICNIGFGEGATHANNFRELSRGVQKMFNMKTYECEFPMKHPKYVVEDRFYEKKLYRIMGRNPIISFYRRCEEVTKFLYFGEYRRLIRKVSKKLKSKKKEV